MRRRKTKNCGIAAICLGVIIILALVMPTGFWVAALGAFFIAAGIVMLRH